MLVVDKEHTTNNTPKDLLEPIMPSMQDQDKELIVKTLPKRTQVNMLDQEHITLNTVDSIQNNGQETLTNSLVDRLQEHLTNNGQEHSTEHILETMLRIMQVFMLDNMQKHTQVYLTEHI